MQLHKNRQPDFIVQSINNSSGHESLYLSSFGRILFWATAVYLVVPLVNIPLTILSPSALFIALVALEVFLRHKNLQLGQFSSWNVIVYFLWLGFLLSIVGNVLMGTLAAGSSQYVQIVRATFWLISFLTIMVIIARLPIDQLRMLIILFGIAVIFLGWVRLYEGIAFGRWGGGGTSRILTQNTYGILFSRFTPFAIALLFLTRGVWQRWSTVAIASLLIAIAANGSRSSWIAVMLGLVTFSMLYAYSQPRRTGNLVTFIIVLLIILTLAVSFLPFEVLEPISTQFATLENVEEDKSFATRQVMVQKSVKLFEENPLFGAGLGQFGRTQVELELPTVLSGSRTDFNRIASHNSYAKHLGETGLVGTIPFALFMVVLLFRGLPVVIKLARHDEIWAIAIFVSFVGQGVHMWTIDNLGNTAPWFIYGMLAGVIERSRHIPEAVADA